MHVGGDCHDCQKTKKMYFVFLDAQAGHATPPISRCHLSFIRLNVWLSIFEFSVSLLSKPDEKEFKLKVVQDKTIYSCHVENKGDKLMVGVFVCCCFFAAWAILFFFFQIPFHKNIERFRIFVWAIVRLGGTDWRVFKTSIYIYIFEIAFGLHKSSWKRSNEMDGSLLCNSHTFDNLFELKR